MTWSSPASIRGPSAFQADALPTELLDRRRAAAVLSHGGAAVPTGLEPATSGLTGRRELQTSPRDQWQLMCTPNGIRTRAATLKGWCPRPLDDGGFDSCVRATEHYQRVTVDQRGRSAVGYGPSMTAHSNRARRRGLGVFGVGATLLVALASTASATTTPDTTPPGSSSPSEATTAADGSMAPAGTAGGDAAADLEALYAAAQEEGQVNLIALPHNWANYGGILQSFNEKYPDIETPVQHPDASSAEELSAVDTQRGSDDDARRRSTSARRSRSRPSTRASWTRTCRALWDEIPDTPERPRRQLGRRLLRDHGDRREHDDRRRLPPTSFAELQRPASKARSSINGDPREAGAAFAAVMAASLANGGSFDDIMPGIQYFAELKPNRHLDPTIVTDDNRSSPARRRSCSTGATTSPASSRQVEEAGFEWSSAVPERRRVRLVLLPGRRRRQPAPERRRLWIEHILSDEGALAYLEGGAIPARYATLVENGTITEDMLANLPPAELIAQVELPDRRADRRRPRRRSPRTGARWSPTAESERTSMTAARPSIAATAFVDAIGTGARPAGGGLRDGCACGKVLRAWAGLHPVLRLPRPVPRRADGRRSSCKAFARTEGVRRPAMREALDGPFRSYFVRVDQAVGASCRDRRGRSASCSPSSSSGCSARGGCARSSRRSPGSPRTWAASSWRSCSSPPSGTQGLATKILNAAGIDLTTGFITVVLGPRDRLLVLPDPADVPRHAPGRRRPQTGMAGSRGEPRRHGVHLLAPCRRPGADSGGARRAAPAVRQRLRRLRHRLRLDHRSAKLVSVQIRFYMQGNVIAGQANVGYALAAWMIVIMLVTIGIYLLLRRRADGGSDDDVRCSDAEPRPIGGDLAGTARGVVGVRCIAVDGLLPVPALRHGPVRRSSGCRPCLLGWSTTSSTGGRPRAP